MGPLIEEDNIITMDIVIIEILNNYFGSIFTSENLNNIPEFNLSYRKKIKTPMTYFRINEQVISKFITNLKLSVSRTI